MRSVASKSVFLLSVVCSCILLKFISVYGCQDSRHHLDGLEVKVMQGHACSGQFSGNLAIIVIIIYSFSALELQNHCFE